MARGPRLFAHDDRRWSMMINNDRRWPVMIDDDDQWWLMMINDDRWWSDRKLPQRWWETIGMFSCSRWVARNPRSTVIYFTRPLKLKRASRCLGPKLYNIRAGKQSCDLVDSKKIAVIQFRWENTQSVSVWAHAPHGRRLAFRFKAIS